MANLTLPQLLRVKAAIGLPCVFAPDDVLAVAKIFESHAQMVDLTIKASNVIKLQSRALLIWQGIAITATVGFWAALLIR